MINWKNLRDRLNTQFNKVEKDGKSAELNQPVTCLVTKNGFPTGESYVVNNVTYAGGNIFLDISTRN